MLALWRCAVGVDEEVLVAVVRRLQRCARLDVDELAGLYVVTLWRIADVDRERAPEDDERLLLHRVPVAATHRAGLVPPDVRTRIGEAGSVAQLSYVAGRLVQTVRAGNPLEPAGANDAKRHTTD